MAHVNSQTALRCKATDPPPQGWWGKMATSGWLMRLLRGLIDGERAYAGPFYAEVSITTLCNQGCLGCQYHSSDIRGPLYSAAGTEHMPLDRISELCESLRRIGTREIILTGEGEPFLHPQLFEIIARFKSAGFYTHLFTNGTLLDESTSTRLVDCGVDVLRVSLWAASAEEYAKCYPGVDPDNFRRTVNGVKLVSRLKAKRGTALPTLFLTGPLNRHNWKGIGDKIRLAHEIGADGVTFTPFRHWRGEFSSATLSGGEVDQVCHDLTQSRGLIESLGLTHNLDEALLRFRLGEAFWKDLPCYISWFHTQIRVDGTVLPCGACPIPLGNLQSSSFEDIWNGPQYRSFRARSMGTRGWALEEESCDCSYCCFARLNARIHRYFRWLAPLVRRAA